MKKAFLLSSMLLAAMSSTAGAFQRLNIIGYRLGVNGINPNDGRIVATNCNGDVKTDLIALTDNRLSSNAWFFASVPKGEEVIRWIAYDKDPAVRPPSDTNNFAGAVTEYVWSYNPADTADRYVVVDYDYISYTLKYDGNGGSGSMANEVYTYTNEFHLAANAFSRTGYSFDCWTNAVGSSFVDKEQVGGESFGVDYTNKAETLFAKWRPHAYTVKFNKNTADDVSGEMPPMSLTYDVPANLISNAFARTGYRFKGWTTSEEGAKAYNDGQSVVNLTDVDGGEVSLYAVWNEKRYTIKYHRNFGADQTSTQGNLSYANPVRILSTSPRKGYTFAGWATTSGGEVEYLAGNDYSIDPGDSDFVHLYAVWTPIKYTIGFNANGGEGAMESKTIDYDEPYAVPGCGFTKTGVDFRGWATNVACGAEFHPGDVVSNLTSRADATFTFYAVWSEPRYVAFNGNGANDASVMEEDVMTFEGVETKALNSNKFEKTGYTFAGWATNETTAVAYTNCADVVSTNLWLGIGETNVFYAVWQTNTYTVVFNANGYTGSMDDQVFYYDQAQALAKYDSYFSSNLEFRGWATNQEGSVVFDDQATVSNLTAEANGVVTLYAVWSNGDLSDAMHCDNLVWVMGSDPGTEWTPISGSGEGYGQSGSSVSNGVFWAQDTSDNMQSRNLKVDSNLSGTLSGKLSFWYKTSCDYPDYYSLTFFADDKEANIPLSPDWGKYGPVDVSDIRDVVIILEQVDDNGDGCSVWIDQMKWEPDGSVEPEDSETVKLSLQNALVGGEEADEKYAFSEGGTSVKRNHAAPRVTFTADPAPVDGVEFEGWELTLGEVLYSTNSNPLVLGGNATCFSETAESNCYVRAKYKWLEYSINYDANDGHGSVTPDASSYIYTNEVALASASPSAGYSFAGWTTNAAEGAVFEPGQVVTGADIGATTSGVVTLYANWTQNVYSVTFCYTNSQGAAASLVCSVLGTENAEPPDAAAYDSWAGHKFVGWDASYSNVVSDVTVNALYEDDQGGGGGQGDDPVEPQYYVVTFDANGGECEESTRNVNCGEAVGELPEAARDNYTLVGWFTADDAEVSASTVPGTNVTYYAKWSIDGLVVTGTNLTFEVKEAVLLAFDECFFVETSSDLKSITASGLPTGVKFDAKTRTFSGTPTKAGIFYVTCVVKNEGGYQYSCTAIWNVGNAPSADNDNGNVGNEVLAQLDGLVTGYAYELVGFTNATAVTGLPTGLKFTKATGVIAGTPTKPGKAAVTLTGVNKAKSVKTVIVVDGGMHALELVASPVESASATGTMTGGGIYAVGKKVTIKATAARGCVFAGWYDDEGNPLVGSADFRTASFPYVVGDRKTTLNAAFATEGEDRDSLGLVNMTNVTTAADGSLVLDLGVCVTSLSLPKLSLTGLPSGLKYDAKTLKVSGEAKKPGVYTVKVAATNTSVKKATNDTTATFKITVPNFECAALPWLEPATDAYGTNSVGVAFDPTLVDCTPADGWTVKAAGLPAGLKWDAKSGTISGVPTAKTGAYTVTFTASKKGEANQKATITLNVEALPSWVVGTFDGSVDGGGLVQSFTVSANGKISGKVLKGGLVWTLSAPSFSEVEIPGGEAESPVFHASVIGKSGKLAFTNEVAVSAEAFGESMRGVAEGEEWTAWQNLWKTAPWKTIAKPFANKSLVLSGTADGLPDDGDSVTLKFAASGKVSASGKFVTGFNEKTKKDIVYSPSCSSVLIPADEDHYTAFVYFPFKDGKFNGYAAEVQLVWTGTAFEMQE